MYMILYYDSRIRDTVVKRWAAVRVECLESRVEVNIPESEIEPHESYTYKDPKIPILFKAEIARELYVAESEAVKTNVRVQREAWCENSKTVHTDDEDMRQDLVREYKRYAIHGFLRRNPQPDTHFPRNIPALSHNIGVVLRNVERKCAAKGIVWLACPSPLKDGKPVAYL